MSISHGASPACGSVSGKVGIMSGQYQHLILILWTQCTNVQKEAVFRRCLWWLPPRPFWTAELVYFWLTANRFIDMFSAEICRSQGDPLMSRRHKPYVWVIVKPWTAWPMDNPFLCFLWPIGNHECNSFCWPFRTLRFTMTWHKPICRRKLSKVTE